MRLLIILPSVVVAAMLLGCTLAGPGSSATPQPTRQPTSRLGTPSSTTAPRSPSGSVIVTFDVEGETYRVLLTNADDVAIAYRLQGGEEAPSIPNGVIIRGRTGVNYGHEWSIDPDSFEFADMTMEICDGLPSHVDDGILTGDRFCPWSAEVIDIEPVE
jgi:hypothetical protein